MKNKRFYILLSVLTFCTIAIAQIKYYELSDFPLLGKISEETETKYERLPLILKDKTRPPVWDLGKNTSGLAVRFCSNSSSISLRWELLQNRVMYHMTATGIRGLDLYVWEIGKWQFVNSARPTSEKNNTYKLITNMTSKEREFLLFLPLYDGVTSLLIGIDSLSVIKQPTLNIPKRNGPIVVYGTSITQGGCATRPGMSYTNILTRELNREFINLGFSGNGRLDYEIAEIMAGRNDASLFILDFVPNVTTQQIEEKMADFVEIIRKKNPHTPLLFIESAISSNADFNLIEKNAILEKNSTLRNEFKLLKEKGYKNIYYLKSKDLLGSDGEATVDGTHYTDLGYTRFSKQLMKIIKKINLE